MVIRTDAAVTAPMQNVMSLGMVCPPVPAPKKRQTMRSMVIRTDAAVTAPMQKVMSPFMVYPPSLLAYKTEEQ